MYSLFETDEFQDNLNELQSKEASLIRNKLDNYIYPQLRLEPHFGANIKKLRGYRPDTWRYRIGNYRVFYTIDEEEHLVFLLVIASRDKAYKK
jgi:mRNA interferase RelE/StbE